MRCPYLKTLSALLVALTMAGALSGCLLGSNKHESSQFQLTSPSNTCSFSERQVYSVRTDPSLDFTTNSVSATSSIIASTCANAQVGMSTSATIDSVQRSGGSLLFTNNGMTDTAYVSGLTVTIPGISGCSQGVSVQGTLSSGVINVSQRTITLEFAWKLTENGCIPASGGGGSAGDVTNTSGSGGPPQVPPSGDSSPYLIYFVSDAGDYIGGGQTRSYHPTDGTFSASRNYDNGVSISFSGTAPGTWWTVDFAAASNATIVPGTYSNATRFPFQAASSHGFDFSGSGRGCNTLSASFTVFEAEYAADGSVVRFVADFEQHCEGATPALRGTVRYNASAASLP
jgi:hypothetical protein